MNFLSDGSITIKPLWFACDELQKVATRAWTVDAPWKTSNLVCPSPTLTLVCSYSGQFVTKKIGFLPLFFSRNTGNRLSAAGGFCKPPETISIYSLAKLTKAAFLPPCFPFFMFFSPHNKSLAFSFISFYLMFVFLLYFQAHTSQYVPYDLIGWNWFQRIVPTFFRPKPH